MLKHKNAYDCSLRSMGEAEEMAADADVKMVELQDRLTERTNKPVTGWPALRLR